MPGNSPSERRRSGSSTPGHVRPEGTPPRKSEATQAKTAPARSHSTRGRRQRRSAQCPSRQARPSIPTATGTAISQRGVRKRVKSLWERDFCVKRQGAHFCACFFRHFGHEKNKRKNALRSEEHTSELQ